MSDIIIKAENLGKSYIIGHERQERYTALRDVIAFKVKRIASKTKEIFKSGQLIAGNELEEFWALKELNFEIKRGDRVGVIGRNGAGKSTLLKILSRITEPTTGKVQIKGRIASLLEVGTGFHPELSGRENIFLNGAILGMSRAEIKKKFDEIIDFSGVEKFLDTPVKRYSSGMYVRLAFAVAAHLEPEILVVDEVLAVGDAEFQKKCLGKMEDVSSKEGRTVLFVSHNMEAIKNLCKNCFVLYNGNLTFQGNSQDSIAFYTRQNFNNLAQTTLLHRKDRLGIGEVLFQDVIIEDSYGNEIKAVSSGDKIKIKIFINRKDFTRSLYCAIVFRNKMGLRLCTLSSEMKNLKVNLEGKNCFVFELENFPLSEDDYFCDIRMAEKNDDLIQDWIKDAFVLQVTGGDYFKSGQPQTKGIDLFFTDFKLYAI